MAIVVERFFVFHAQIFHKVRAQLIFLGLTIRNLQRMKNHPILGCRWRILCLLFTVFFCISAAAEFRTAPLVPRSSSFFDHFSAFSQQQTTDNPLAIDYKSLSKTYHPSLQQYNLDLNEIAPISSSQIALTNQEKQWLRKHPEIDIGIDGNWPPIDFLDEKGIHSGISAEYLQLLGQRLGVQFQTHYVGGFKTMLQQLIAGTIKVGTPVSKTKQREQQLWFTRPFIESQRVIYTRNDNSVLNTITDLYGKTVAVEANYYTMRQLQQKYPQIQLLPVNSTIEALRMVSFGKADAFVGNQAVADWLRKKELLTNLRLVGDAGLGSSTQNFAVSRKAQDWRPLVSILDKALADITPEEHNKILNRWLLDINTHESLQHQPFYFNWWLLYGTAALFGLLLFTMFLLPRRIPDTMLIRFFGSGRFKIPLLIGMTLTIMVVAVLIDFVLEENRKLALESVRNNLTFTLHSTVERIDNWIKEHSNFLLQLGQNPQLVSITEQLLSQPPTPQFLHKSTALTEARQFFTAPEQKSSSNIFFIINPQQINIGAVRNSDLGIKNLIAVKRPDLLKKTFAGKVTFIPPISSSDNFSHLQSTEPSDRNPMKMFLTAPIRNTKGRVIAVLAQQLSNTSDLSAMLHYGRIGSSGESYAINIKGIIASASRFRSQLIRLVLISPEQHEAGILEIRNPGGNLLPGHQPPQALRKAPLTRMAAKIILLHKEGVNSQIINDLNGYNDYRGIPVFGVGLWHYPLDLGLITEFDVAEAMAGYYDLRLSLLAISGLLLLLFTTAIVFTLSLTGRASQAMRRAQDEQFKLIINSLPVAIVIADHDGTILLDNPQAISEIGNDTTLIGRSTLEFYADKNERTEILSILSKKGQIIGRQVKYRIQANEIIDCLFSAIPVNFSGKHAFLGIILNLTERVKMEQALAAAKEQAEQTSRFKSQFLANMSHEIRTPMNAIVGLGHLLTQTKLLSKQQGYVNKIQLSAQSLLAIIDDILDISKIEAGQLKIENIDFNLDEVMINLATLANTRIEDQPIEFIYRIDTNIPWQLHGDPHRLRQILSNLVDNAIKFTHCGNILLSIDIERHGNPLSLKFKVEDTGIGIPPDKINDLFEPFTQVDGTTRRHYKGTGLGLSICRQLTELMGGKISIKSKQGKGSCFQFSLPFTRAKQHNLPWQSLDLSGMHILLAEHHSLTRQILADTLNALSFHVDVASTGEEAIKMLSQTKTSYGLVLLDWQLAMDSIETTRRIRACNKKYIPIIMMLYPSNQEAVELKLHDLDLNGLLCKPITPAQLFNAIIQARDKNKSAFPAKNPVNPKQLWQHPLSGQVLLIEDNPINQQVAQELLEQMGLQVEVCASGAAAVYSVQRQLPDLILMDIQMPDLDGYEATSLIRQIKGAESLPIIAMTAHAMAGDAERSITAGMDGHITKPVDPYILYETMQHWLNNAVTTSHNLISSLPLLPNKEVELPGIDINCGLKYVGNNEILYQKLLRDFLNSYGNVVHSLQQHLADNKPENARRQIHSLLGVAATLGATNLATTAASIDDTLNNRASVTAEQIDAFSSACEEVFTSLSQWLHSIPG
jgi:PAS domain S-box-containing protein